jgi:predicted DNA-binding protein YlxM (UPF0122 family)
MTELSLAPDAKRLNGWVTAPQAARMLRVSKQAVHDKKFKTVVYVGDDVRKLYLLDENEVRGMCVRRAEEKQRIADTTAKATA